LNLPSRIPFQLKIKVTIQTILTQKSPNSKTKMIPIQMKNKKMRKMVTKKLTSRQSDRNGVYEALRITVSAATCCCAIISFSRSLIKASTSIVMVDTNRQKMQTLLTLTIILSRKKT
jgi:hypothetical protein